jgi:hypothetical protein
MFVNFLIMIVGRCQFGVDFKTVCLIWCTYRVSIIYVLIEERLTVEILSSFDSFLILLSLSKDLQVNDSQTKIISMYVKVLPWF